MDTTVPEAQRKGIDKRARSPSSEEAHRKTARLIPSLSGKVCVVCRCTDDLSIFILDLASEFPDDGFVHRRPTLSLDYNIFGSGVFCVLGSRLFVFESSRYLVNSNEISVFSYDLSSIDDSKVFDYRLERTSLTQHAGMNYPKLFPAAVPTPDGKKLLVFSTLLNDDDDGNNQYHHPVGDETDFELYDPIDDSWEELPPIQHYSKEAFNVLTFSFIDDTTFVLQTDIGGFALNLLDPEYNKYWKPVNSYRYGVGFDPFCVIEGELLLTPSRAYDVTRNQYSFSTFFPFTLSVLSCIESIPDPYTSSCITLLDGHGHGRVENGKCNYFCVVTTVVDGDTWALHMFVDVCGIDVNKYREDKEKEGDGAKLEAFHLGAFKFIVDDEPFRDLFVRNVFFMSAGT